MTAMKNDRFIEQFKEMCNNNENIETFQEIIDFKSSIATTTNLMSRSKGLSQQMKVLLSSDQDDEPSNRYMVPNKL